MSHVNLLILMKSDREITLNRKTVYIYIAAANVVWNIVLCTSVS